MDPIVSIILPTYNGNKKRISESIDSVLGQTFTDFELIIINDASKNDIEDTILKYKKKDKRIVYLKNDKNLKLSETLNKGIKIAKGKYIGRIDDDDIWINKDKLEKQVNFMEENPNYGLCGCEGFTIINEEGEIIEESKMRTTDKDIREHILYGNTFSHSSVVIKKSVFYDVGLYNRLYYPAEDYELWCRIGKKYKFDNLKGITLKYRINNKGMSGSNKIKMRNMAFKIYFENRKFYPNSNKAFFVRIIIDYLLPKKCLKILQRLMK